MAGEVVESNLVPDKPDRTKHSVVPARAPSWFEQDVPYEELVGNIRRLIGQAREQHRQRDRWGEFDINLPFTPAEWLGLNLRKEAGKEVNRGKAQRQLMDLQAAWDALYCDRYVAEGGEWSKWVKMELEIRAMKQSSLTLSPKSVTLLDAMAEAAGLPRKRGEATIDLTPYAKPGETPPSTPRANKSIIRRLLRK